MINRIRRWFKSWTINTATVLTILGLIQTNLTMLDLTPHQQGIGLIVVGAVMAILRAKTTKPLSQR